MIDVTLAILAALFYGLANIFVRKGLVESNYISASFMLTIIGNIVFWTLTFLFVPLNFINPMAIALFVLSGMLAPTLARLFSLLAIERVGVSIKASIFATYPVFGSIGAVILLREQPTIGIQVGTSLVICGAVLLGGSMQSNNSKSGGSAKAGLVFSVLSSMAVGLFSVFGKMGLNIYDEPILGVAIGNATALLFYTLIVAVSDNMRSDMSVNRHAFRLFWKPGVLFCLAWIAYYYAILFGDVVVVTPISNTEALFVFLFAYLYLEKLEKITSKLILGAVIIIFGVALISIF